MDKQPSDFGKRSNQFVISLLIYYIFILLSLSFHLQFEWMVLLSLPLFRWSPSSSLSIIIIRKFRLSFVTNTSPFTITQSRFTKSELGIGKGHSSFCKMEKSMENWMLMCIFDELKNLFKITIWQIKFQLLLIRFCPPNVHNK